MLWRRSRSFNVIHLETMRKLDVFVLHAHRGDRRDAALDGTRKVFLADSSTVPLMIDDLGMRVIYYLRRKPGQIWMLTLYGKNAQENIAVRVLRQMKEAIDDGKDD